MDTEEKEEKNQKIRNDIGVLFKGNLRNERAKKRKTKKNNSKLKESADVKLST